MDAAECGDIAGECKAALEVLAESRAVLVLAACTVNLLLVGSAAADPPIPIRALTSRFAAPTLTSEDPLAALLFMESGAG